MILSEWAKKWGVSQAALYELRAQLGADPFAPKMVPGESETAVQTRIRLEASEKGLRLWRNNVGVLEDDRGIPVRYGLANDSKQMNTHIKSHDLIGIRPIVIEPHHVGSIIGQFVSREVKREGWKYTGTKREVAQLRWAELVISLGGDAAFANSVGSL